MEKIVSVSNCFLSSFGEGFKESKLFGVSQNKSNYEAQTVYLLLWALTNSCADKQKIYAHLQKITKFCKDCAPKRRKKPLITKPLSYELWLNSQEYLDCLKLELSINGFLSNPSEIEKICKDLNIVISQKEFCNFVYAQIQQTKIDCSVIATVNFSTLCKKALLSVAQQSENCKVESLITQHVFCEVPENLKTFSENLCKELLLTIN